MSIGCSACTRRIGLDGLVVFDGSSGSVLVGRVHCGGHVDDGSGLVMD